MNKHWLWIFPVSLIILSLFWPLLFGIGLGSQLVKLADMTADQALSYETIWGDEKSPNKYLSIQVNGPIYDEKPSDLGSLGGLFLEEASFGYDLKQQLIEASQDESIAGVILEIRSPGGTVTGSVALADGVSFYKEQTNKPIIAFGSGVIASGAYWGALPADKIVADNGTLVGSIGVIGPSFLTYNGVTEYGQGLIGPNVVTREGVDLTVITAGEGKDFGNPFRQATPKELELAQASTDEVYSQFKEAVRTYRQLEAEEVGAYVYSPEKAKTLGLIDEVANKHQAYDLLAELGGHSDDYQVVQNLENLGFWGEFLAAQLGNKLPNSKGKFCSQTRSVLVFYGNTAQMCPE